MWSSLLLTLCVIVNVLSNTPPFITKCKPDDKKCLKETMVKAIPIFADGIPELNVEQLDPMKIAYVDASTVNIKLILSNLTVIGLKNCEPEPLSMDMTNGKITLKIICTVNLDAQYEMDGQLLVFSITGKGNMHATLRKILISAEVYIKEFHDKEGKKHWSVKSWKHNFNLIDQSLLKFQNLFPNNEFLRNTINELINTNSNDLVYELGPNIIKAVVAKVLKNIENFFGVIPLEDLIID